MADLWVAQGVIFGLRPEDYDRAVEAYDMALSYVPGYDKALHGLADILEKREDWGQLVQILEASLELQTPIQQAAMLRRMAGIYRERLVDAESAEAYLRRSVALDPSREALETLKAIYDESPARYASQRLELLGHLVRFGPPYFALVQEVGQAAQQTGKERLAWATLSPLQNVRTASPELKGQLRDMRKAFDNAELSVLSDADYASAVRHPLALPELTSVLAEVDAAIGPLGTSLADSPEVKGAYKLSPNAGLGKTCAAVLEALGMPPRQAFRADGLGASWIVVGGAEPSVLYLTEFLRQFVRAESNFLFGYTLEWARPGHVVLAASTPEERDALLEGLFLATGLRDQASAAGSAVAERLEAAVPAETLAAWAGKLTALKGTPVADLVATLWEGIDATARRVGLLMAGDLLSALRGWGRVTAAFDNPQGADVNDLDDVVKLRPELADLLAFAASPAFGRLLG
jgi:hypothetical protein